MLVDRLISGSAALLRWTAEFLESRVGDNTGVISGTNREPANDCVPAQDPVTPEARALLRGECAHGMPIRVDGLTVTSGCAACAYVASLFAAHGVRQEDVAVPAAEYFPARPARRVFRP
jgi:hypothetical protein